ncbi:MAG: zinc ribbon domain-containing protein [Thermogemmatispora sp.]|uniref:Uncharacterized protein n=1 Tax=Thermogemmatispora aurantia TaxID=2045279 RepID=A0A5J4K4E1_9CHLR|nr:MULTISPECIES: zinc ribbon domain-containing protein [Thermogemmatispora]MBE3565106.1 zinc ribbon domain-containing protein [Thermogemmatispora sp.]GER82363.1 hypothetical protein KTAU_10010 [Thermogemmatispora aurantia]
MQCNRCGAALPTGAASCPVCGNPTPYNLASQTPYDPTVAAIPSQGTPPPPPATNYGPQGSSPYGPPSMPTDPYSPSPVGPYVPGGPGPYGPPPTPPRKSNLGKVLLIVGAVLLVIVAACCGGFFIIARNASNNVVSSINATATAIAATASAEEGTASSLLTPTTTVAPTTSAPSNQQGPSPSGSPIATSASAIVTKVQMADQVNDVTPTHLTSTFKTHQTIYATFEIKSGNSGYMVAKWYLNNVHAFDNKVLQVKPGYDAGYFAGYYNLAGQGAVEIYWCTTSDCSDAQLAQVATFTVEESS